VSSCKPDITVRQAQEEPCRTLPPFQRHVAAARPPASRREVAAALVLVGAAAMPLLHDRGHGHECGSAYDPEDEGVCDVHVSLDGQPPPRS
jgi:hypothetical protein